MIGIVLSFAGGFFFSRNSPWEVNEKKWWLIALPMLIGWGFLCGELQIKINHLHPIKAESCHCTSNHCIEQMTKEWRVCGDE